MSDNEDMPPIGVVLHDEDAGCDELLTSFATSLRDVGCDIGGLVQKSIKRPDGRSDMFLIDIRTGQTFGISQPLGQGSDSCCLDPGGLAEASGVLRREIEHGVALLVINKFASAESDGRGLVPEMFEAISRGIPVLTALSRRYRSQWDALTGGAGEMLKSDPSELHRWWAAVASRDSAPCPA